MKLQHLCELCLCAEVAHGIARVDTNMREHRRMYDVDFKHDKRDRPIIKYIPGWHSIQLFIFLTERTEKSHIHCEIV